MVTATAPGKIILFGEHAVVYGQPALAVPVAQVRATATVASPPAPLLNAPLPRRSGARRRLPRSGEGRIWIEASDLNRIYLLDDAPPDDPLALAVRLTFTHYGLRITDYALQITLSSTIPLASGLGSGAAICTALVRALAAHFNSPISNPQVSGIVFETEKLLHGTPSGIDNTVVAYEQPVYFVKGRPPKPFTVAQPFHLLIADTGLPSPTKITVSDVRAAWQREPARYDALFGAVGDIVNAARAHIENGQPAALGPLMNRNHALLREMGVSCAELDTLVDAALDAGALGAKLSGGGRGGNMLALVTPEMQERGRAALERAGAKRVISTVIQ
jgi:mevalonate kinase